MPDLDFPLLNRIYGYLLDPNERWEMVIELAVIWIVVFVIMRFLRGTRGARVIKGLALLLVASTLVIRVMGGEDDFERLKFLYNNFLGFMSLLLVIVFQPELRRALMRLGEASFFRGVSATQSRVVEELLKSVQYLSRNKIGGLIALEGEIGLRGITEHGTPMDARISSELLNTIFFPGSALHDMGVVVHGERLVAAGVQFPLAEAEHLPQELGSRHRAAIGLSQDSDALVIVVSEETGTISVAQKGQLHRNLTVDDLRPWLSKNIVDRAIAEREDTLIAEPGTSSFSGSAKKDAA